MDPKLMFDLRQIAVKLTTQVDQQPIVGKFQKSLMQVFGMRRRGQGANAQANLLRAELLPSMVQPHGPRRKRRAHARATKCRIMPFEAHSSELRCNL
jgi:hypothetical protein